MLSMGIVEHMFHLSYQQISDNSPLMFTKQYCSANGWGFQFEERHQPVDSVPHHPPHFLTGHSAFQVGEPLLISYYDSAVKVILPLRFCWPQLPHKVRR